MVRVLVAMVLVGVIFLPLQSKSQTGVAFIHGKGSPALADEGVARMYWGYDMLRVVTKNYRIPHCVAHYNGTLFMTDAARVVGKQLSECIHKYDIDDLVINAHSFGGIVLRVMFSIPRLDPSFQKVLSVTRWVNTIASPHKGSKSADLADRFEKSILTKWLVDLLDENQPSTMNLRTADMAYYNDHFLNGTAGRPDLPVPFYTIAGTDTWSDFIYTFHYEDIGLALLEIISGFNYSSDGMVDVNSAHAVGRKWFNSDANHHHIRRNDFRPIGRALARDFD